MPEKKQYTILDIKNNPSHTNLSGRPREALNYFSIKGASRTKSSYIWRPGEVMWFTHRADIYQSQPRDTGTPGYYLLPDFGSDTDN